MSPDAFLFSLPALRPHLGEPLSQPESEPASRSAITGGKLACLFQLPEYSGMLRHRRGSSVIIKPSSPHLSVLEDLFTRFFFTDSLLRLDDSEKC